MKSSGSAYVSDPDFTLYVDDVVDVLAGLPDESVHCCVTSPPYWGLRDYGTGSWDGGDPDCDHAPEQRGGRFASAVSAKQASNTGSGTISERDCKCGAARVDKQLGLESTPEEYVARMVDVFREVGRVLRRDGTCWLNIGDSYSSNPKGPGGDAASTLTPSGARGQRETHLTAGRVPGIKVKDLVGIPWRLAFALQQPYYTGTIKDERDRIWLAAMVDAEGCLFIHKRKAGQSNGQGYERKNASYGAGLEVASTDRAIVERCIAIAGKGSIGTVERGSDSRRRQTLYRWMLRSNECRDIVRELYPHFVAKHHEARLLLGCPSSGADAARAHESLKSIHQGEAPTIDFPAPASLLEPGWYLRSEIIWAKKNCMPESVTDRPTKAHEQISLLTKEPRYFYDADAIREPHSRLWDENNGGTFGGTSWMKDANRIQGGRGTTHNNPSLPNPSGRNKRSVWEIATESYPDAHFATFPQALVEPCIKAGCPEGGTVLDPFMGSGTTALVARRLGRKSIGIELNPVDAELAARRLSQLSLLVPEEAA